MIGVLGRIDFGLRHERDLTGLFVRDTEHDQVQVNHRFRQCRGAAFGGSQIAHTPGQITANFFRSVAKECIGAGEDRTGIAQPSAGGHDDLVASQRDNRRSAQRFVRNPGHRAGPRQVAQFRDNVERCLYRSAGAVNFEDDQIDAHLLGLGEFAVQVLLQLRQDHTLQLNDHAFLMIWDRFRRGVGGRAGDQRDGNRRQHEEEDSCGHGSLVFGRGGRVSQAAGTQGIH